MPHPVPPPSSISSDEPVGTPTLLVRQGAGPAARIVLAEGLTTIGRAAEAVLFLDDITVSRRHATIRRAGDAVSITDHGSLNGTYLNGRLTEEETPIGHGDELRIGVFTLRFLVG